MGAEAGCDPYDRQLSDLIGELSTRSEKFRIRWAAHNVRFYRSGLKRFHHPLVGGLTLAYEAPELPADGGQPMITYAAEPDSPSHDALTLLADVRIHGSIPRRDPRPLLRRSSEMSGPYF